MHASTWGDGEVTVILRYDSGEDGVIHLQVLDWLPEARTQHMTDDEAPAHTSDEPNHDPPHAEMVAQTIAVDAQRQLRALTFSLKSKTATVILGDSTIGRFTAGLFAVSALPADAK